MKKRIVSIFLTMMMVVTMLPMQVSAAGTVKMTTYDQVYKTKNTVYCIGAAGIYKVTVKNGKVKKVKKIYKETECYGDYRCADSMKKKGGYLYFIIMSDSSAGGGINRVNIKTTKEKCLSGFVNCLDGYAIKDKKIYYRYEDDNGKMKTMSMSLNGKNKKKSSMKVSMDPKKTNTKGYSTVIKIKDGYVKDYLKTPKGKFYLGKIKKSEFDY